MWPDAYDNNFSTWSKIYVNQNKCAEKFILSTVKKIVDYDEEAIILIHSDHGMDHDAVKHDAVDRKNLSNKNLNNLLNVFCLL